MSYSKDMQTKINKLKKYFYTRILFQITHNHSLPDCFLSINTYKYNKKTIKNIMKNINGIIKYSESIAKLHNKYFHSVYIDGKETSTLEYFKILYFTNEGKSIEKDIYYDVELFKVSICIIHNNYPKEIRTEDYDENKCVLCLDLEPRIHIRQQPFRKINCYLCGKLNQVLM